MTNLFLSNGSGRVAGGERGRERRSRNGGIETEIDGDRKKREMDAAMCACQRQGHPLGDFSPEHAPFGNHGDTVNEDMHSAANQRMSVLKVHRVYLCLQTEVVSLSFPLCPLFIVSVSLLISFPSQFPCSGRSIIQSHFLLLTTLQLRYVNFILHFISSIGIFTD